MSEQEELNHWLEKFNEFFDRDYKSWDELSRLDLIKIIMGLITAINYS